MRSTDNTRPSRYRAASFLLASAALAFVFISLGEFLSTGSTDVAQGRTILVLGGGVDERIAAACAAYHRARPRRILWLFGSPDTTVTGSWTLRYYRDLFNASGVPDSLVLRYAVSGGTWDEAAFARGLLVKAGCRSVHLITDPPNARRVRAVYDRVLHGSGIDFTVGVSAPSWWDAQRWWRNGKSFGAVAKETVKYIYYSARYFVL